MLITIDKRGSISLPAPLRRELGLRKGSHLNLEIQNGGAILLQPVSIYPSIRLNEDGLSKLKAARKSEKGKMPDWLVRDMNDFRSHTL